VDVKSGYKQTELGIIPADWETLTIGSLMSFTSGSGISVASLRPQSSDAPFPVYGGNGIAGYTSKPLVQNPVVIIGRVGQKCGEVYLSEGPAWITDNALYPRVVNRKCDMRFLAIAMAAAGLNEFRNRNDLPLVTQSILHSVLIAFPPKALEQELIANAVRDVDTLIKSLAQLIAKKTLVKIAVLQALLTGKTRLPGYTGEWKSKKMGDICDIAMGGTPARLNPAYWGRGFTWLSIGDLRSKTVSTSKEQITASAASAMNLVTKGTLLMSFKLSIGRLCFAGCDLYTNEAICSFNNLKADAGFLYYALGRTDFSLYGKQAVKGFTLNKESLKAIEVNLPPDDEQKAIATVFNDMDVEIGALESQLDKLWQSKLGITQELLTGRIRLV
jgi:type I restriction enzyme S subunit